MVKIKFLFVLLYRTMVVILVMTFGRCGSLLGNLLFPYFISMGCVAPFLLIGGVIIGMIVIIGYLNLKILISFKLNLYFI